MHIFYIQRLKETPEEDRYSEKSAFINILQPWYK